MLTEVSLTVEEVFSAEGVAGRLDSRCSPSSFVEDGQQGGLNRSGNARRTSEGVRSIL